MKMLNTDYHQSLREYLFCLRLDSCVDRWSQGDHLGASRIQAGCQGIQGVGGRDIREVGQRVSDLLINEG